jgi:TatD DNase family protein
MGSAPEAGSGVGLIDTHAHLDDYARRGELPGVLAEARAAGVGEVIAIGTESGDWPVGRDMAARHPGVVHYTAGLHPCSVGPEWAGEVAQLAAYWAGTPRPVALGECGLDRFHLPQNDPTAAEAIFSHQRGAFAFQLALARREQCPVVVHSRGAFAECLDLIDHSGVEWSRVVFHCFTEGPAEMAELTRRGGRGSFTGILTYKTAEATRAAAKAQGLDRLILETDAPYLAPVPRRGGPNRPAYVRHTADYAAQLFGVSVEELARITTRNARAFFGL